MKPLAKLLLTNNLNIFFPKCPTLKYNLRRPNRLTISYHRTQYFENQAYYRSIKCTTSPLNLEKKESNIKKELKKVFLDKEYRKQIGNFLS